MEIFNCEQGDDEWFQAKLGVPSSSKFSDIMAKGKGKTRRNYLVDIASEIITGKMEESYVSADMKRGTELEPFAREEYEFITGNNVEQIGFAKDNNVGCSPDGLIGKDGGLEIKCPKPSTHIETVISDVIPAKHRPQMQGCMMVTGRKWWDFCSYCPDISGKYQYIFIKRMARDELYIKELQHEINLFLIDLKETVKIMEVN